MRRKEKKKNGRTGETEPRRRKEKKKREEQGRLNPGKEREEKKKEKVRLVLFVGPSCVYNYKNVIEL